MTTTDFSTTPQPQLDTGPLSWVMVEIRESLARSRTALFEAGGREPEDQATQLQHAKSHLHQAHGALQIVDIDGVGKLTEVAEAALDAFKAGTVKCTSDHAQAVAQLYQALVEYLEELLEGAPSQPARLFPYYRAVQEMLGVERIHPADLFYPDLSLMPALPPVAAAAAPDYAACRQRFERALLPYMKSTDAAQQQEHAAALLAAVEQVAEAQQDGQARAFWLAMQAFAELVAGGQLAGGLYVKQLFGMINLQLRRLSQGTVERPEGMLRDALFFVATAGQGSASAVVQQVRRAFALDGLAPADYDKRRYGQVDMLALERAKAGMAQAKAAWDRLAHAEIDAELDAAFVAALGDVAAECDKLNLPPLAALLRQLADVARRAVSAGRSEELALEMATALLFAEHGLQHIRHLPDDFAAHADTIGARLQALVAGVTPPEPAQWKNGLARQMQQDDTVVALAGEMKIGLRQVEKVLDDYYADKSKRATLADLEPVLHQLQGALSMLDQDDATQAVSHVQASVQALARGEVDPSHEPKALDDIAQNVGALGFFVDMLGQNATGARERFAFDAEHGSFRSVPFKKISSSESIPVLEEQVPAPVPVSMPVQAPPPAASDAAVEQELLDIFIGEAQEVLSFVDATLARPRAEAGNEEHLTMLRRSFHTLKGSGRMVGLNQFADAAYAIERVMNLWLAEARPATDALFGLLNKAARELGAWVAELVASGVSPRNAEAIVAAAARVQEGGDFSWDAAEPPLPVVETIELQPLAEQTEPAPFTPDTHEYEASAEHAPASTQPSAAHEHEAEHAAAAAPAPAAYEHEAGYVAASAPVANAHEHEAEHSAAPAPQPDAQEHEHGSEHDSASAQPLSAHEHEAGHSTAPAPASIAAEPLLDAFELAAGAGLVATELSAGDADAVVANANADHADVAAHLADEAAAASAAESSAAEVRATEIDAHPDAASSQAADAAAEAASPSVEAHDTPAVQAPAEPPLVADAVPAPARTGNVIEFPTIAPPTAPADDNVKHIGDLQIPLPLYNIYLQESDSLLRHLVQDFGEWRHEPRRPVNPEALQAAHTLAGTSGTVGFKNLRELALALESTLQALLPPAPHLDQVQHDLLDFTMQRIRQMLQSFAAGEMPSTQPELISALQNLRAELAATPPAASNAIEARLDDLVAETMDSINAPPPAAAESEMDQLFRATFEAISGSVPESDAPKRAPSRKWPEAAHVDDGIDDLFNTAFDDTFAEPPLKIAEPAGEEPLEQEQEAARSEEPAPAAATAEAASPAPEEISATFPQSESTELAEPAEPVAPEASTALAEARSPAEQSSALSAAAPQADEPQADEPQPAAHAEHPGIAVPDAEVLPLPPVESHILAAAPTVFNDELDADLLPVFLEEGADLLPQVGEALRAWQHHPADTAPAQSLLRLLHTVKGSARMAGAMRLGQHVHEIETHVENVVHAGSASPQAFDELLAHYDHALLLFEQLQHPQAVQANGLTAAEQGAAADASGAHDTAAMSGAANSSDTATGRADTVDTTGANGTTGAAVRAPAAEPHAAADELQAGSKSPLVRVRADILDRLVNQAGEVSISRSRLENEVTTLRASLADFSDNLARLRRQLREVEMQAESQIASRMSISSDREFDPLEFDRFTRLQELTRMMAESVNDVAAFHEGLSRSVDNAGADLAHQAGLTRDLQRDLMRVRMVPFASISERLFRVARQSAKEVDKRVNLDIRGGNVEIDRSVLERMAAPFEHLLRNAIAHGVESRDKRAAAGKAETGELLVQVAQQGNEVVIEFSDDGGGLDLERIKAKAISVGLLGADEAATDVQIADLIFQPGFSTADTLTELSGRGVGMDVVQSEAQALGGRVDMYSESGQGTRFTIRLPLTLAVTQVVLLAAGGKTYALPAILVEQVLQMRDAALADARQHGHVAIQGQQAELHYLPTLLGDPAQPPQQRSVPVMMLKNGNERLALQVDEVLGNREVVIKNIGPQLSRMAGIAGATVLGTGDIVLILNPVALAQHLAHHPELKPHYAQAAADSPAAQAAYKGKTLMVVDDSVTVRRVTQRLLEREGYRVLLAKDGVDALEQLQGTPPDLMLVDIEMPRMDGFDLTRNVRGDERTRHIPIIMITSRSADKHRNVALELGVNAYFGKPYQEPVLLNAIEGLLKQAS